MRKYDRSGEKAQYKQEELLENKNFAHSQQTSESLYNNLSHRAEYSQEKYLTQEDETIEKDHHDISRFTSIDLTDKDYVLVSELLFNYIDYIKDYYGDNMNTETFWSAHGAKIHTLLATKRDDLETKIRLGLVQYVEYYVNDKYPDNILDQEDYRKITPKFIKSLIYYKNGRDVLGENLRYKKKLTKNNSINESHYGAIHLDTSFEDFLITYNIQNNHLSDTSLFYVQQLYSIYLNKAKEDLNNGSYIYYSDYSDQNKTPETILMSSFQYNLLDKILIPHLRHKKTNYDLMEEYIIDRNEERKDINRYVRREYLEVQNDDYSYEDWEY